MASGPVLDWLLEEDQPSIRYRTLTEILGRPRRDPDVRRAREEIRKRGWAAEILAERSPGGGWSDAASPYRPKYTSTNWRMIVLSDLAVDRSDRAVRDACEYWMRGLAARGGMLGGNSSGTPHYCVSANMARALIRLGYGDDPRVLRTLQWLVRTADPKGGWSCFGSGRNLDSWEAMAAFAAYPRSKWTPGMRSAVDNAASFYLDRRLHRQGGRYAPWYRFHYPTHYYYDLLVGLDFMTELGYGADPRLGFALSVLQKKRRPDGRWELDAVHPDVGRTMERWYRSHPKDRPTPWALEAPGKPSKMLTLTALRVLSRLPNATVRSGREHGAPRADRSTQRRRSSRAG